MVGLFNSSHSNGYVVGFSLAPAAVFFFFFFDFFYVDHFLKSLLNLL